MKSAQMMVRIVDMTDNAILQEIINYAKENKICDVYLLDKSFVKNAIEKQIPKKVKIEPLRVACPICNYNLWEYNALIGITVQDADKL